MSEVQTWWFVGEEYDPDADTWMPVLKSIDVLHVAETYIYSRSTHGTEERRSREGNFPARAEALRDYLRKRDTEVKKLEETIEMVRARVVRADRLLNDLEESDFER